MSFPEPSLTHPNRVVVVVVCLGGFVFFFSEGVYFPTNYQDGVICKSLSKRTLEGGTLGSPCHDSSLSADCAL